MATLSTVSVDFVANTAKYTQGLTGMQKQTKDWSAGVKKDTQGATNAFGGVSKAFGSFKGTLAAIGITTFLRDISNTVSKLSDLSDQLNIDTTNLQKFESLFQKSGNTLDDVSVIFSKLQKSSIDAADGNKNLNDAFVKLGINVEAFNRLTPTEQLERFSRGLVSIENPAERAAIAQELLGKTSRKTLTALTELGQGGNINKFNEGIVIASNESIAALDNLLDGAQNVFTNIKRLTIEFIGSIVIATSELVKMQKSGPAGTTTGAAFMGMGGLGTASAFTKSIANASSGLEKSDLQIAREEQALIRQRTAADKERTDALALQAEAFRKLRDSILATVDPSAKYASEVDKINEIVKKNKLSEEDRIKLIAGISQAYILAVDPVKKYAAEIDKINADKGLSEKQKADNIALLGNKYDDIIDPASQYKKLIEDLDALVANSIKTDQDKRIVLDNVGSSYRALYDPTEKYLKLQRDLIALPKGSNVNILEVLRNSNKEARDILKPLAEVNNKIKESNAYFSALANTEVASLQKILDGYQQQGTLTQLRLELLTKEKNAIQAKYQKEADYVFAAMKTEADAILQREMALALNSKEQAAQSQYSQDLIRYNKLVAASQNNATDQIRLQFTEEQKAMVQLQAKARLLLGTNEVVAQGFQYMSDFADQFSRAIVAGENFGEALSNVFKNILKDITTMILRITILQGIMAAIGIVNPVASAAFGQMTGLTPRANGGPVMAGGGYRVGERGPETFVPAANGYILPNDMAPSETVVVNQTINVQTGVAQTVRAEMASLLPKFKSEAMAGVLEAKQRGGSYSRGLSFA